MESVADKIVRLDTEIQALGVLQLSAVTEALKISYGAQITAKTELLTTLIKAQQGKFASPISVVLSYSYRSHIFCPLSFDISSLPIQCRHRRKVRGDVDS